MSAAPRITLTDASDRRQTIMDVVSQVREQADAQTAALAVAGMYFATAREGVTVSLDEVGAVSDTFAYVAHVFGDGALADMVLAMLAEQEATT